MGSRLLSKRSTEIQKALGQLFVVGFDGTELSRDLRDLFRRYPPGGVVLFRRNLQDPDQIRRLTRSLQEPDSLLPTLVCIDQEGGRVWRLPAPFTFFPEARSLGIAGADSLAHSAAKVIAQELAAVGIHCNFAPVLDLDTRPSNPVIGDRAFGSDPSVVAVLGRAILFGFRAQGVAGCGKHFPGHGDTDLDSHDTLPTVSLGRERLFSVEMSPYRILARDPRRPLEFVMTAHVSYPALDPRRPATLSARILRGVLRGEIGFQGIIITDDLEMGAIKERYGPEEASLLAFRAGADLLMFCHTPLLLPRCIETLRRSLERGQVSNARLMQSLHRIERFKKQMRRRMPDETARRLLFERIGCDEHRRVAGLVSSFRTAPAGRGST
jgi:beta-N-acetylhexosaminidase